METLKQFNSPVLLSGLSAASAFGVKTYFGSRFDRNFNRNLLLQLLAVSTVVNGINYLTLEKDEFYDSLYKCTGAKVVGIAVSKFTNNKVPLEISFPVAYMAANYFM